MKKILFYPILGFGHMNVCICLAQRLLDLFDDVEIYFLVDKIWAERLAKMESRCKYLVYELKKLDKEINMEKEFVEKFKSLIYLTPLEQSKRFWSFFRDNELIQQIDKSVYKNLIEAKPDLILMDQFCVYPSVYKSKIPYAFIMSAQPYALDKLQRNILGSDAFTSETERVAEFREIYNENRKINEELFKAWYKSENIELEPDFKIFSLISEHFTIYCYPKEIDIFDEKYRKENRLLQIDSPVNISQKLEPFVVPAEFLAKPGKLIYVSLGTLFSAFTDVMQKLIDDLADLPHKFIISKGMNGDKLKLPENFLGENFLNQKAVLQVVDLIISHGGNNTVTECFYFGVPMVIFPILIDQHNNLIRLLETGFTKKKLNLISYTKEELHEAVNLMLNDEELTLKWSNVSKRIQKESRVDFTAQYIHDYLNKIQSQSNQNDLIKNKLDDDKLSSNVSDLKKPNSNETLLE